MGRWWRRKHQPEDDRRPDPVFPFFTEAQGARFRGLAQQEFARAGVEVVPHAERLDAADGQQFGLGNLAASCHNAPQGERDWPDLIERHVATILRAVGNDDVAEMAQDEAMARVCLRLLGTTTMPPQWHEWYRYARPVGGDLVEVLALDFPESVTVLRDEDVQRFGEDSLRAAALEHLLGEPVDSYDVHEGPHGESVHVVLGDSVFTASKVLVLDDLLRRTVGEHDFADGVLVAVPFRHQLAFHPIQDSGVVGALQTLAGFAATGYTDGVGALSPFVYWWRRGRLTQLSFLTDDHRIEIHVGDEFGDLLNRLASGGTP